jgi:PKD repeat protein
MINPVSAFSGSGSGTELDPYQITDVNELQEMNDDLTAYYILMNNIDASDTVNWNSNAGFTPIGDSSTVFMGNFDGQGYTITGLYINRSSTFYVGLFGYTSGASISNVSLEDVNVTGQSGVGGLVGLNDDSSINQSHSTGNVTGADYNVGGLIGENDDSSINQSYSTCNVTGNSKVGGLVGFNGNYGSVNQSYSTGDIIGNSYVGGLVGHNYGSVNQSYSVGEITASGGNIGSFIGGSSGTLNQCYVNIETSGVESPSDVVSLTTSEMKGSAAFNNMDGFDTEVWDVVKGGEISYPYLLNNKQEPEPGLESLYAGGSGTESDPYQIENWYHLNNVRACLDSNFTLVNDINDTTEGYNEITGESANDGTGFEPIGNDFSTKFTGTFDGQRCVITDLYINRTSTGNVGLFGYTDEVASISNVSLKNINVTGNQKVGGLVGYNYGSVDLSNSTGNVTGSKYIGGLVGENTGSVNQSHSTGNVTGSECVGGLVGDNAGSVNQSYSTSTVKASSNDVGGLVGYSDGGSVTQSYSTGDVTGNMNVGGLVGFNYDSSSTITECHSTGSVTGNGDFIGGLVGYNYGIVIQCYSTSIINDPDGNVGGLVGYNENSVTDSYWNMDTSGMATSSGGTGLNDTEMQDQSSFTSWNFTDTWRMDYYPSLQYQSIVPHANFTWDYATNDTETIEFIDGSTLAVSYTWDLGDGNTSTSENEIHTYSLLGSDQSFDVKLTVESIDGISSSTTKTVTVYNNPEIGFDWDHATNDTESVNFTGNIVDGSTYTWNFGDSNTSTEQNPSHTYAVSGSQQTYDVTLTVENEHGGITSETQTVTVYNNPEIGFDWDHATNDTETINFTDKSVNVSSYTWDFGDSNTSTEQNPSHTYAVSGSEQDYNVTLTIENEQGGIASETQTVTVYNNPVVDFSWDHVTNDTESIEFTDNSVDGSSYTWDFGDSTTSTEQNPSHTYVLSEPDQNYDVTLTVNNGQGGITSETKTIFTFMNPEAEFGWERSDSNNGTVIFTDNSINRKVMFPNQVKPMDRPDKSTISWNFGDGTTSEEDNPVHQYPKPCLDTYEVTLTVTNGHGSTDVITKSIKPKNIPSSNNPINRDRPLKDEPEPVEDEPKQTEDDKDNIDSGSGSSSNPYGNPEVIHKDKPEPDMETPVNGNTSDTNNNPIGYKLPGFIERIISFIFGW